MHRVRMLQHFGVTPYIVFDGDYLPSKAGTETDREKRREASRMAGLELLNAGKTSQAYLEFQKAVDVTPEMARQLIDELKKSGVQYVVAPYEADAQMVYLERHGIVDGIISEDSDLLVFGAKCLLTKLDQYGNCIEINKADFCACKEITLTGWSDVEFRQMAILSGCDYLASISNMGLKTAYRMVRKHKTIEKVIRMLQFDGKFHVPKGYLEAFRQAELTFLHQRVFCPKSLRIVLHTQPEQPIDEDKLPFIGAYVEPDIAQGVARGDLNPMTKLPIVVATRNSMVTPTTPWATRPKHQRSVSSVDLKKGVSIDNFFKARRTPLAELDINLFTPSPSQQNALSRNPGPWLAQPILVPRPYLTRSSTEPQLPHSLPPRTRTRPSPTRPRAPTASEPRPSKRARLCADIDTVVSPNQKVELGPSRFFASTGPEPSPTVGRQVRNKRSKKQDVNIFSDDSIEEAMLSLPDFDGFDQKPKKKIPIFQESVKESKGDGQGETADSQKTDADLYTSQSSVPSLSTSTSISSSAEQPPTPRETDAAAPIEKLKERFAFAAGGISTPKTHAAPHGLPTPSSSMPRSKIPVPVNSSVTSTKPSPFFKPTLTPLARMGANAVNRPKLPVTPPITPTLPSQIPKPKSPRRSLLNKDFVPFPEVVRERKSKNVEPSSIPLPAPDDSENAMLNMPGGSEDLIIHDSEGEDEALSPGPKSAIDFGAFVYTTRA